MEPQKKATIYHYHHRNRSKNSININLRQLQQSKEDTPHSQTQTSLCLYSADTPRGCWQYESSIALMTWSQTRVIFLISFTGAYLVGVVERERERKRVCIILPVDLSWQCPREVCPKMFEKDTSRTRSGHVQDITCFLCIFSGHRTWTQDVKGHGVHKVLIGSFQVHLSILDHCKLHFLS